MIFIEAELTSDPTEVTFPVAKKVTFLITLSDDEGPATHTLTFVLGRDNQLSWEPLTAAEAPVKESEEKVRILKTAREFSFDKRIFGPPAPNLAFFVVRVKVPDTDGSACRIKVV